MTCYVAKHQKASRLFKKREIELLHAIRRDFSFGKLVKAAEKLREARLKVLSLISLAIQLNLQVRGFLMRKQRSGRLCRWRKLLINIGIKYNRTKDGMLKSKGCKKGSVNLVVPEFHKPSKPYT